MPINIVQEEKLALNDFLAVAASVCHYGGHRRENKKTQRVCLDIISQSSTDMTVQEQMSSSCNVLEQTEEERMMEGETEIACGLHRQAYIVL